MYSAYSRRLPMVLLLAVSTSISAIHTLLPRATSELLRVVPFTVTPNIETFHSLIYETFIKRQQVLTPNSKVFGFLRDTFLDLNQSIDGVIAKLQVSRSVTFLAVFISKLNLVEIQYMYLAHYFGNPASVLCNPLPEHPDFEDQLELLGNIAPTLRSLPSAQKRIERHTEEALAKKNDILLRMTRQLLESDEELLRAVNAARRERALYAADLPQAWALFEILQSTWAEGRISMETMLTEYFSGTLLKRTSTACRNLR